MQKRRGLVVAVLVLALTLVASACAKSTDTTPSGGTSSGGSEATGLLGKVMASGELRVSTDPKYPPQSSYDQKTGQWEGFDIDVATEVATRMGVQIKWITPSWTAITSGHWSGRWDLSVGSMTVTPERAKVLDFSEPYYFTPAAFAVYDTNTTITQASDLNGKKVGVCGGCTYESYLNGDLVLPGETVTFQVTSAKVVTYDTDSTAIQDLALGDGTRLDAVISALPTLQEAAKQGKSIKVVGDPLYYEPLAAAADKSAADDPASLVAKVSEIIADMHEDGTLAQLSCKWYGQDLTANDPAMAITCPAPAS